MGDRVAIVGCCDNTYHGVKRLFGSPDWEIWGINQLWKTFPELPKHATGWFQIHDWDEMVETDHNEIAWLASRKFPIYMRKEWEEIPTAIRFPKEEIVQEFGTYFTNCISWMIAFAIHAGFKEIHLYGIDMAMDYEYGYQRPSCEYFIGLARGMGVRVYIPRGSDLLKTTRLYGFEDTREEADKIRSEVRRFSRKILESKDAIRDNRDRRMELEGALLSRIDTDEKRAEAEKQITERLKKDAELHAELYQYIGMKSALEGHSRAWGHF